MSLYSPSTEDGVRLTPTSCVDGRKKSFDGTIRNWRKGMMFWNNENIRIFLMTSGNDYAMAEYLQGNVLAPFAVRSEIICLRKPIL